MEKQRDGKGRRIIPTMKPWRWFKPDKKATRSKGTKSCEPKSPALVLKSVGYWSERLDDDYLIHPARLIDRNWQGKDRDKIIAYLRNGITFMSSLGWATCRFPDGPSDEEMGCRDLTDGTWVWPEGLWVYVQRYGVRLPDEFVQHMSQCGFQASKNSSLGQEVPELDPRLRNSPSWTSVVDSEFWKQWTLKERLRAEAEEAEY